MRSLARLCYSKRWFVLVGWIVFLVALWGIAGAISSKYRTDFELPGSESQDALDLLEARGANDRTGITSQIVFQAEQGLDDPAVRATLAQASTELEVGRLLLFRAAWLASRGEMPQVEGSMAKLHITETFVRASADLLELLGAAGLLAGDEPGSPLAGLVEHAFRHSVVTTIYGGSSEVQREIIARGLGL